MSKKRKNDRQLSLELSRRSEAKRDASSSEDQRRKVVTFVDARTRAIRVDAIKRVQAAGIFA